MSTSKYIEKANTIVQKSESINTNLEGLKEINKTNIQKLKNLKESFFGKFNELVNAIQSIPEEHIVDKTEEISPASIVTTVHWEWLYNSESNKQFQIIDDLYTTTSNSSYGTMNAFSSHAANENFTWKVKFHNTGSFGCGGFGLISKNDPNFERSFGNYSGHPLFCLCCSSSWSASYMSFKGGDSMQYRLKRSADKILSFELNIDEGLFKVYDPEETLFAEYYINSMLGKDDYVLFYYTTSNTNHSHEIIPS